MKSYLLHLFLPALLLLTACGGGTQSKQPDTENYSEARTEMEARAQQLLVVARRQLAASQNEAARQTIRQLRKECYLALSARREAILLMDSVDLQQARLELSRTDSLMRAGHDSVGKEEFDEACRKVQFYERKIQFDFRQNSAAN